jgi:hypothetical protein
MKAGQFGIKRRREYLGVPLLIGCSELTLTESLDRASRVATAYKTFVMRQVEDATFVPQGQVCGTESSGRYDPEGQA